jgi:hypothetical protein
MTPEGYSIPRMNLHGDAAVISGQLYLEAVMFVSWLFTVAAARDIALLLQGQANLGGGS